MMKDQELLELAQQLLDAAHYCTQLEKLEDHCREVARKLEAIAERELPQSPKLPPPERPQWPAKGDWYRFLGRNGYDFELEAALKIFTIGREYLVEDCNVQSWSHSIKFDDFDGWYNGVMFERVTDTRPDREGK